MEVLKLDNRNTTLVDSVEESLIRFFKEKGLRPGSSIPNEIELAASLGVGRPVLREALSRFKMTGMIVSRTKKGMILGEPSLLGGMKRCINPLLMNESTLRDILEFRIALEIGISNNIFCNLTPQDNRSFACSPKASPRSNATLKCSENSSARFSQRSRRRAGWSSARMG